MSRNRIDEIITRVLAREGDAYTQHVDDSGGPTKFGITQGALSEYLRRPALASDVERLTIIQAREFYYWRQVHAPKFDQIAAISLPIGAELIDTGTLTGPNRAAIFLQRSLNALNLRGLHYPDVIVDGDAGPRTRDALRMFLGRRGAEGETVLLAALNSLLGEFLIDLAERRPKDETFVYGWLKARVVDAA